MLDPRLGALQANVQTAQMDVNTAQVALTQAQQDAVMATQGLQYGFQVLDPAQLPTVATPQTKKIIIYPIVAVIIGLGLMGALLVLLVATDRSIRFHRGTRLPIGRVQIADSDGAPSWWIIARAPDALWVTRESGDLDVPDGTFLQIVRTVEGGLSLRRPK